MKSCLRDQIKIHCSSTNPVLFGRYFIIILTCGETFLLCVSVRWCTCPWACDWVCTSLASPISVLCACALMMRKRAMLTRDRESSCETQATCEC